MKYHDPVLNAATLLYGICNDHPFHNGNKRTALVAALAHFDRNHLILGQTKQSELFRLMIAVADHSIVRTPVKIGRETKMVPRRGTPDEEVKAIADWFRPKLVVITRGEAQITYRELRQILCNFGFSLSQGRSQKMNVSKTESRRSLFGRSTERLRWRMAIRWRDEGKTVPISQIKHIRQTLGLCEEDGVTREAFYEKGVRVDRFINEYRQVLTRLASR